MLNMNTDNLIKVSSYARERKLSLSHIYRLIKQGRIKTVTIDGMIFIVKDDNKD